LIEEQIQNSVLVQDKIQNNAKLCQQRHWEKIRVENELTKGLLFQFELELEGADIFAIGIHRKVNTIVQSMAMEFDSCIMLCTCQTILR
jgi:hypothetical protein